MAHAVSVQEVMQTDFLGVSASDSVDAVIDLLRDHYEDTAIVLEGSEPIGIVLARDLLDVIDDADPSATVDGYMQHSYTSVTPDATIDRAADRLVSADTDRLLVLDHDKTVVGLVRSVDVLAATDLLVETPLDEQGSTSQPAEPASLSEQGLCEACGRLTEELTEINGSMLCSDCAAL